MVDYLIVGGGIYGCALAWELAHRGYGVRILESDAVAGKASGGPGRRGVRANGRDRRELPLMALAYDTWPELHQTLGCAPFYERVGQLLLMESPQAVASAHARCWMQNQRGIETHLLGCEEVRELEPDLSTDVAAALFCPKDGVCDHGATTKAYADSAKKLGAVLSERCTMETLESNAGRVHSATTQSGERIGINRGVFLLSNSEVATQVRELCGLELPVWNACLQVLVSEPLTTAPLKHLVGHTARTVSLKRQGADRIMISGGWPGVWDESTQSGTALSSSIRGNVAQAIALYPSLADLRIAQADASHLEAMSVDDIPIIDKVPGIDNVWFTTGCSGHGWAIAPVITELLAAWVECDAKPELLEPFALRRFF